MRHARGFTLIEMIIAMVITGILAGVVAVFIGGPVRGYVDTARRAELTDMADLALKRMALEIRTAVPNTVNISSTFVEFIPTSAGGRYCTDSEACPNTNPLKFGTASLQASFDVLGPSLPGSVIAGDQVIIYNTGQSGLNAYSANNCATHGSHTSTSVSVTGSAFPYASPSNRFFIAPATGPVRFSCSGKQITRSTGTAFCGITPAATSALLLAADDSVNCNFTYDQTSATDGLVTLKITLTSGGESVTLYDQIHVDNMP